VINRSPNREVVCVRTKNAITFVSGYPTRHVQVVLKLFKQAQDVLMNFDLDCVCFLSDGNKPYCVPRALRPLTTQMNFIEVNRYNSFTNTNNKRLKKYKERGFGALLINRDQLPFQSAFLFSLQSPSSDFSVNSSVHEQNLEFGNSQIHNARSYAKSLFMNMNIESNDIDAASFQSTQPFITPTPLYDQTYIPFGPEITLDDVREKLRDTQEKTREKFLRKFGTSPKDFVPFVIFGTIEDVLKEIEFLSVHLQ